MPLAAQAAAAQPARQGGKRSNSGSDGVSEGMHDAKRPVVRPPKSSAGHCPPLLPSPISSGPASASGFRGVTFHQRTGRYESHIWCRKKQVYLGGWDTGSQAALAYDIAALHLRGEGTALNFHPDHYRGVHQQLAGHAFEEVVSAMRALSRGGSAARQLSSCFRGVSRHQKGKWEARIGTGDRELASKRYLYLGLHDSEVAAAMAYDRASIREKGVDAGTNFHLAEYAEELEAAQLSDAVQRGIITPDDLALRQKVAAVVAAGGHPGELLGSAIEAAALTPASPSMCSLDPQLSPGTQSGPGSPDLASLLLECVCLEGESPTSVLPGPVPAAASNAAEWQRSSCFP